MDSAADTKDGEQTVAGLSFEAGMRELEELVQKVEAGNLSLEKVVSSYEHGVKLVKHLRGLIKGAEEKIRILHKDMSESEGSAGE